MPMPPTYRVDPKRKAADVGGFHRYVVAVNDSPVVKTGSNGMAFHMTYKTSKGADTAARLVYLASGLHAHVVDKGADR